MDFDRELFESFVPGEILPAFRLYRWSPPAVSLGRFQRAEEVLWLDRCVADGVGVARRITGGGAILHADELTYSLVCPDEGLSGVEESYRRLCGFLLQAYRELGLDPVFARAEPPPGQILGRKTAICFAGTETCDLRVGGKKIGGNAQRRRRGVVFQHGSIPLTLDPIWCGRYFRDSFQAAAGNAAGLRDFLPGLRPEELQKALIEAFAWSLEADLVPESLKEPPRYSHVDM